MYTPIYRVSLIKEKSLRYRPHCSQAETAALLIQKTLMAAGQIDRENFVVLFLNTKNLVIGSNIVAVGGLKSCSVSPGEVFKPALVGNAASIIIGHNHPSGSVAPSSADHQMTKQLCAVSAFLDVPLLDHVIIDIDDETHYFSFANNGFIREYSESGKQMLFDSRSAC